MAPNPRLSKYNIIAFLTIVDVARAKEFYRDKLGLRLISEEPPFALVFDANGIMLRLGMGKELPPVPGTVLGWQVPDIVAAVRDLQEVGIHFERYDNADVRVLLAALCLHGLRLRETAGWHLRSECDLIPTSDMRFELLRTGGEQREQLGLTLDESRALLTEAVQRAGVEDRSVQLVGGPHLTPLVERALEADRAAKSG